MNFYSKLIIALGLVSGVAAGLLSLTYSATAPVIESRSAQEQENALSSVFFRQMQGEGNARTFALRAEPIADGVTALFHPDHPGQPVYYAALGSAYGYNSSTPVVLIVGFTGPGMEAANLLEGYVDANRMPAAGVRGEYIVGFSVISSAETPGLGENIRNVRPAFTWAQFFTGNRPPANPDRATAFQSQFRGRKAADLLLKKKGGDLDAITASTLTSNAVGMALQNASENLGKALHDKR